MCACVRVCKGHPFPRCTGLLDRKSVLKSNRHILQCLIAQGLSAPDGTIAEVTTRARGTHKTRRCSGFIASLDGDAIIKGNEKYNRSAVHADAAEIVRSSSVRMYKDDPGIHRVLRLLCQGRNREKEKAKEKERERERAREVVPAEVYLLSEEFAWLRVRGHNEFTPLHADVFFFKEFTDLFVTRDGGDEIGPCSVEEEEEDVEEEDVEEEEEEEEDGAEMAPRKQRVCVLRGEGKRSEGAAGKAVEIVYCAVCRGHVTGRSRDTAEEAMRRGTHWEEGRFLTCLECHLSFHWSCLSGDKLDRSGSATWATWRCEYCNLFREELTLATCWIPLQDITVEDGVF